MVYSFETASFTLLSPPSRPPFMTTEVYLGHVPPDGSFSCSTVFVTFPFLCSGRFPMCAPFLPSSFWRSLFWSDDFFSPWQSPLSNSFFSPVLSSFTREAGSVLVLTGSPGRWRVRFFSGGFILMDFLTPDLGFGFFLFLRTGRWFLDGVLHFPVLSGIWFGILCFFFLIISLLLTELFAFFFGSPGFFFGRRRRLVLGSVGKAFCGLLGACLRRQISLGFGEVCSSFELCGGRPFSF